MKNKIIIELTQFEAAQVYAMALKLLEGAGYRYTAHEKAAGTRGLDKIDKAIQIADRRDLAGVPAPTKKRIREVLKNHGSFKTGKAQERADQRSKCMITYICGYRAAAANIENDLNL